MRPICLLLCLALGGCSLLKDDPPPPPPLKPVVQSDVLKPGDGLHITVAGEDELSGAFTVSSDGNIRMELLGAVKAASLSPAGLEEDLRQRLAAGYLRNPQVRVERAAQVAVTPPRLRPSL
jgi:protein involved in polysaccharide export with SLBB domain